MNLEGNSGRMTKKKKGRRNKRNQIKCSLMLMLFYFIIYVRFCFCLLFAYALKVRCTPTLLMETSYKHIYHQQLCTSSGNSWNIQQKVPNSICFHCIHHVFRCSVGLRSVLCVIHLFFPTPTLSNVFVVFAEAQSCWNRPLEGQS